MSEKDTGGPAFPYVDDGWLQPGMHLRDYFAAKAMQSMCAEVARYDDFVHVAKAAYKMADAMLEARK